MMFFIKRIGCKNLKVPVRLAVGCIFLHIFVSAVNTIEWETITDMVDQRNTETRVKKAA